MSFFDIIIKMVGIIILNYNNATDIVSCVKSILENVDENNFRIVVVDNGSNIDVRDGVERAMVELSENSFLSIGEIPQYQMSLPLITYLKLPVNLGYARGNNAGFELLKSCNEVSYIMICNSDIIFTSDIITPLANKYPKCKDIGALSPMLYRMDGSVDLSCARSAYEMKDLIFTFSYLFSSLYRSRIRRKQLLLQHPNLKDESLVEVDMPSGSCMLFEKSVFEEIEGFDPNTFLYYEEAILYHKLKTLDRKNYLIPTISCIHTGGATTSSTKTSLFLKKCNIDSLLYFMSTYMKASFITLMYIKITGVSNILLLNLMQVLKRIFTCILKLR